MIPKEFTKTSAIFEKYNRHVYNITRGWSFDDWRLDVYDFKSEINPETSNSFGYDIVINFKSEYDEFTESEKYFMGCPFTIYKSTYSSRLRAFIEENSKDLYDESHFVKTEVRDTLEHQPSNILNKETLLSINKSLNRRKEFLIERLEALGYAYRLKRDKYGKLLSVSSKTPNQPLKEDIPVDFSNSSIAEKIIYLKKLGVYDYLSSKDPFNMSKNKLATALSAITGERSSSIQSAINPIDNPSASQKNNPMNNTKKTEIVSQKLIDLGFIPEN